MPVVKQDAVRGRSEQVSTFPLKSIIPLHRGMAMSKQLSFTDLEQTTKKKQTRREIFLAEMDKVMPWSKLEAAIEPFIPNPAMAVVPIPYPACCASIACSSGIRSDPAMEESLYEIASMRHFAQINIEAVPDETTMLNFRHLLEKHAHRNPVSHHQPASRRQRADLKQGTIVDATLINAPSSTKNAKGSAIQTCTRPRRAISGTSA
jgi:IS5 family transposase